MTKKINSSALQQEFVEGSSFFKQRTEARTPLEQPLAPAQAREPRLASPPPQVVEQAAPPVIVESRNHDTTVETTTPRYHDSTDEPKSAVLINPSLDRIRRVLKHLGKEAATHRFTIEEKRMLKKIEHEYAMKGVRTSENEITRIAINYIAEDYRQHKDTSILAQVLELLNN